MLSLSERRRRALARVEQSVLAAERVSEADQCPHCLGIKSAAYPHCIACHRLSGAWSSVPLYFATIVANPSGWYGQFVVYKQPPDPDAAAFAAMAAALSGGAELHWDAITRALGGTPDTVTPVPSTGARGYEQQPLVGVIKSVSILEPLCQPLLERTLTLRVKHSIQDDLFRLVPSRAPERVVLIEDLFVGGTTAASAATVLQSAGASVAVLGIGREVRPSFLNCAGVISQLGRPRWWGET